MGVTVVVHVGEGREEVDKVAEIQNGQVKIEQHGEDCPDKISYGAEMAKDKCSEEGGDAKKPNTSPKYALSESASETPVYGSDDEDPTDSIDEGIVATDDDKEEEVETDVDKEDEAKTNQEKEVESKDEKSKRKIVSKIPRIVITDDTRRRDEDGETKNLSKVATKIPRRP